MWYLEWSFQLSLVTGSILCATDPVAVVALLKELGASPTLTVQIQGESLLNDGTAIVLYTIAYAVLKGETWDVSQILTFLVETALMAWALGMVIGYIFYLWIKEASNKLDSERSSIIQISLTLCCAYWSFIMAEGVLHISGVLSTVAAALVLAHHMWPHVVGKEAMHHVWHAFEALGNMTIFFLAGALAGKIALEIDVIDYIRLVVLYIFLIAVRFCLLFASRPILTRLGKSGEPVSLADTIVIAWGGLRGAVGLALAIQVSIDRGGIDSAGENRIDSLDAKRVLFFVAGVAFLTTVINATTSPALVSGLGLAATPASKKKLLTMLHRQLVQHCYNRGHPKIVQERIDRLLAETKSHLERRLSCESLPSVSSRSNTSPMKMATSIPMEGFESKRSFGSPFRLEKPDLVTPPREFASQVTPTRDFVSVASRTSVQATQSERLNNCVVPCSFGSSGSDSVGEPIRPPPIKTWELESRQGSDGGGPSPPAGHPPGQLGEASTPMVAPAPMRGLTACLVASIELTAPEVESPRGSVHPVGSARARSRFRGSVNAVRFAQALEDHSFSQEVNKVQSEASAHHEGVQTATSLMRSPMSRNSISEQSAASRPSLWTMGAKWPGQGMMASLSMSAFMSMFSVRRTPFRSADALAADLMVARQTYERVDPEDVQLLGHLPEMKMRELEQPLLAVVEGTQVDGDMAKVATEAFLSILRTQYLKLIEERRLTPGSTEATVLLTSIQLALSHEAADWRLRDFDHVLPHIRQVRSPARELFQVIPSDMEQSQQTTATSERPSTLAQGEKVEKPVTWRTRLQAMLQTAWVNILMALVIVCNSVVLVAENLDSNSEGRLTWLILETVFTVIFLFESALKLAAFKRKYFKSRWNVFDLILVWLGIFGVVVGFMAYKGIQNAEGSELVRVALLLRALRLLRLFRLFHFWMVVRAKMMSHDVSMEVADHMWKMAVLVSLVNAHLLAQTVFMHLFAGSLRSPEVARCLLQSQLTVYKALNMAIARVVQMDKQLLEEVNAWRTSKVVTEELSQFIMDAFENGIINAREAEAVLDPLREHIKHCMVLIGDSMHGVVRRQSDSQVISNGPVSQGDLGVDISSSDHADASGG